ncbi:hypothetical protein FACS1894110_20150 [Spirochaetia bacterium]|nr:hypothetical protein FACS1894110_20150 [Spirochaetia bacterium]
MNKLVNLTVDAEVLSIPKDCTKEFADSYFKLITNLSLLLPEQWISIQVSQDAKKILENIGTYPSDAALRHLIEIYGNKQIPHKEIIKTVNELFNPNLWMEEYFQLTIDKLDRKTISPDCIYGGHNEILRNNLFCSVSMIAFIKKYCKEKYGEQYILLKNSSYNEIEISAHITRFLSLLECLRNIEPPQDLEKEKIKIFKDLSVVLNSISFDNFFQMNINNRDFEMAIKIKNYQFYADKNNKELYVILELLNQPLKVKVGKKFLQGCIKIVEQGCSADQIFDTIIKKINNIAVDNDEKMDDESGRPRKRGNDTYWRCRFNAKFRLHYWRCQDEVIELSLALDHLGERQPDYRVSYE